MPHRQERSLVLLVSSLATMLLLIACDGQGEPADPTATSPPAASPTPTETAPTATPPPSTSTSRPSPATSTPSPTTSPPEGGAPEPAVRCESPGRYSISYPEEWSTNPGDVVPPCSQFDPEPFEVPRATDERVAAITLFIDPVPFSQVMASDADRDAARAVTAIDGLQATRVEYETQQDGLWPAGTPVTRYTVDVGTSEEDATLFLDTIGLSSFDYPQNEVVLDRMARTLDVEMEGLEDDPTVVARYAGGGGGFSVEGEVSNDEACLRIPPGGDPICTDVPAADQLHTIQLEDLGPVLAGVTGEEVFAVTAERQDGASATVLPAPIGDSEVGGFSFTFGLGQVERLILTDLSGAELRTIRPGG